MVVIQIKSGNADTFLYETTCDASNSDVVKQLVRIWNLRLRLQQLAGGIRELAKYGPMKLPDKAGLDKVQEECDNAVIDKGPYYLADPTGLRTGNGVGPQLSDTIERVALDAEAAFNSNNVMRKIATSESVLQEKLDNIRGAVIMAFPMGLPEWDIIRLTIQGNEGLNGSAAGTMLLNEDTAEVWIASRMLDRSQIVADRLGRNEKTKVIAKMQGPGSGAPAREAAVSEEEQKAMMAFYFKKQEELKQLADNSEDAYLNSSWADSRQLQNSLRGQSSVRAPGIR